MRRVLVTSARQDGFVLPMLRLVRAMTARGDAVWFLGGETYRERVEAAGATFVRLPYDEAVPASRVSDPDRRSGVRELGRVLRTLFLDTVEADHRAVRALHDELRFDLVVTEPLFVGAVAMSLLPREERPAVLVVGFFPLPFRSVDTAPYGSGLPPAPGARGVLRNAALWAAAEATVLGGVRRAFHAELERLTGSRPTGSLFDLPLVADAYAHTTVPGFEYPRRALSRKVRFVGPLPPPPGFALPSWWDYGDARRIVHVTQGTYANGDLTELVVPTLRALADRDDLLVVATTGGPAPDVVEAAYGGPLPANARVERFMSYEHLLPSCAVMVTNGGFGSVHHALRWGVPLVVAGTTEDRAEVNARVAWTGAGLDLRAQRPAPERIREAVLQVLDDHGRHRRATARLARAIAATDAERSVLRLADELCCGAPAST
ncbi:nucleotide disphospho-sugar-binding domain-containing protein [Amnibacterium endophyticum]|uniref:Nucleotide disphospho-sugar-binding domain-containing protein n=1 Tax=Amnibacterium endophyticum TaxID=2109337 RepID=A0ABW4LDC9_9MICO